MINQTSVSQRNMTKKNYILDGDSSHDQAGDGRSDFEQLRADFVIKKLICNKIPKNIYVINTIINSQRNSTKKIIGAMGIRTLIKRAMDGAFLDNCGSISLSKN